MKVMIFCESLLPTLFRVCVSFKYDWVWLILD